MRLEQAYTIFGLIPYSYIDKNQIKKIYRKLMIENHPDHGGDEELSKNINEAKMVLDEVVNTLDNGAGSSGDLTSTMQMIPFDYLPKIFSGENWEGYTASGKDTLTKENIRHKNVFLNIEISAIINGKEFEFKGVDHVNGKDEYRIFCDIDVCKLDSKLDINVKAYGKEASLSVSKGNVCINFSYDCNVRLSIILERRLVK